MKQNDPKRTEKKTLPPEFSARLQEASLRRRAGGTLSLPADAVMSLPQLSLTGNRELTVDGVKSITEYNETRIGLLCGRVTVTVTGVSLIIERYFADTVVVTGILTGVNFS